MGRNTLDHVAARSPTGTGVVGAVETPGDWTPAIPCPCNRRIDTAAPHKSAARTPVPGRSTHDAASLGSQSCDTNRWDYNLRARQKLVRQTADQGAETQSNVAQLSLGVCSLLRSALGRPSVSNMGWTRSGVRWS